MVNKVTGGRQFRQKLKQAADNLKSGKSLKVGFLEGVPGPLTCLMRYTGG